MLASDTTRSARALPSGEGALPSEAARDGVSGRDNP